jgi:phospholipid/cholesterol/gamma-HCH transport system permease protein
VTSPSRSPSAPVAPFASIGRGTVAFLGATGRVFAFALPAVVGALTTREGVRASAAQAVSIAYRCALPVMLVAGPVGAMLSLQALTLMRMFGVERVLAPLCVATVIREIAPGFAAVVVSMQGGAGIAAELGAMRNNAELDALFVMGIDARAHVAGPRIVGAALAAPLMNAIAIFTAIFGAFVMALAMGVPRMLFVETALDAITVVDVWVSEAKTILFGAGLGAVCATAGFFAPIGPAGVGKAANRAVVASVIVVLVANYLVNTFVFGLHGGRGAP